MKNMATRSQKAIIPPNKFLGGFLLYFFILDIMIDLTLSLGVVNIKEADGAILYFKGVRQVSNLPAVFMVAW